MAELKRTRARSSAVLADPALVAQRVIDFYTADVQARAFDIEARLQRQAKYRMWTEGKTSPWNNSSDVGLPDMPTASLKMQDTLHNAVMASRPVVNSKAFKKTDADKQEHIDQLLDYQFFVENRGEVNIGKMAERFVNDGVVRVFIPWVKEERATHDVRVLPKIPDDALPGQYFALMLMQIYPRSQIKELDQEGWRWQVTLDVEETFIVDFFTLKDGSVEMDSERIAEVFNGPCPIVKDYEDVCKNARSENLQIPSPSNPRGSAHVILVDYPTLDEVKRLVKSGFYDLVDKDGIEKLGIARMDTTDNQALKEQQDVFAGVAYRGEPSTTIKPVRDGTSDTRVNDHKTLTRLMCFDIYDVDADGVNEDVIWWVIKEEKLLLRSRELTQAFPSNPPRRPFAESEFLPSGVSLLEMMEGLHDVGKQIIDQTIDFGTLTNVPWGLYRSTSSMRPETIHYQPGELYGVSDPRNDVYFPQMPQAGSNFGFNMLQVINTMEERLLTQGDLQYGRVPQGKASALRTVRGMQSVLQQGESRPERVLRRFFMCLTEIYAQMHELNQAFLPVNKQYRVTGVARPNEDPYRSIADPAMIRGRFAFDFVANAMNTSKGAMQEALGNLLGLYLTPLAIQLGIVQADGAYNLFRDMGKAFGQDPDRYLTPPSPDSMLPKALAEEVITIIMSGNLPEVRPLEPPEEHMALLMDFANKPEFGLLTPSQVDIFRTYIKLMQTRVMEAKNRAALMAAAGATSVSGSGVSGPVPAPQQPTQPTQLGPGELADKSLPAAGGGANPGPTLQ